MSYQDLKFDGQLYALEKMVSERADDRPELARYRLSLVFFKVLFLNFILFIETSTVEVGNFYGAVSRKRRDSRCPHGHL